MHSACFSMAAPLRSIKISSLADMYRSKAVETGSPGFGKLAIILGLLAALGPFGIDTYLPAFPTMVGALHAAPWQIQWSVAIYFVGLALGQIFYGPISDRLGRRIPLFAGLILFIAGAAGCALSTSGWELLGFRFIQALGGCAQMVISRAMVRDYFEAREAAHFYSMIMLVSGLAPVTAPILGGWLLTHLGWSSIFWFMAAIASLAFLAVFFGLAESHPPERRRRDPILKIVSSYGALLADGRFMAYVMSGGVISGCLFAYISGSPFVYMEIYGVRPEHFGLFFGINALGLMAAGQMNRYLLRCFNMLSVLRLVTGIVAAAAVLVGVQSVTGWGGFPALLLPLFVCVSCFGFVMPMTTALAMAPHGAVAGNAAALLGTLQFFLSGLAGMAVGAFNNGTAIPMGGVIAFCGLTGFIINRCLLPKAS